MTIKEWSDLFLERTKLTKGPISLKTIRSSGPKLNILSNMSEIHPLFSIMYSRDIITSSNNEISNG